MVPAHSVPGQGPCIAATSGPTAEPARALPLLLLFSQLRVGLIGEGGKAGPGPQEAAQRGRSGKQTQAKCFWEP